MTSAYSTTDHSDRNIFCWPVATFMFGTRLELWVYKLKFIPIGVSRSGCYC